MLAKVATQYCCHLRGMFVDKKVPAGTALNRDIFGKRGPFRAHIEQETLRWADIVKKAKIAIQ
mgnify:CR=1 FL=1